MATIILLAILVGLIGLIIYQKSQSGSVFFGGGSASSSSVTDDILSNLGSVQGGLDFGVTGGA